MAMQLEALAGDERSDGEANEMGGRTVIDVDDGSSDEVQFIGEKKTSAIQGNPIKLEESSLHL